MSNNKLQSLSLDVLVRAVRGTAAAFRSVTDYQPAGGSGTAICPPTYEGGKYAMVGVRADEDGENKRADQVILDSVQSQANRMEEVLRDAWEREDIALPVVTVDFSGHDLPKVLRVTSLDAPHRIADALLRDSLKDGKPFRRSQVGKRLDEVDNRNATALFELCPTALVLGLWDSTGPKGGLGAKFARAIVSEIVGYDVVVGKKTSSRIDPAQITLSAGPLYRAKSGEGVTWTLDEDEAERDKKKTAVKLGKDGKPSEANHGNVTPTIAEGGVTISKAVQTTVLSLTALRRLRFPLSGKYDPKADDAARAVLAALGLLAAVLVRERGCDLRSRCQLFPTQGFVWELLDVPGDPPKQFSQNSSEAVEIFKAAVAAAKKAGLPWMEKELVLEPSPQLVALVKKSQELAAGMIASDEEDE
jgi:CRISPR-associated protein Csb1